VAWLEKRSNRYRINFRLSGRKMQVSLKTTDQVEAEGCLARLEENLRLVERGRLDIPADADIGLFLISDGKVSQRVAYEKPASLKEMCEHYLAHHPEGAKEANTRYTERIHLRHLNRLLGESIPARSITTEKLQAYVGARSQEKSKFGRTISHVTIKKEIATLASIWNQWGKQHGFVSGPAPTRGLIYGKAQGKPPFQTWEQIERQIARNGLNKKEAAALWKCVYLTLPEIGDVLTYVKQQPGPDFFYPMLVLAAYTGARRSEMLRSRVEDFDFEANVVTIREKKKDKSKDLTFRTVPMAEFLRVTMHTWLAKHPGGQWTFCEKPNEKGTVQLSAKVFRQAMATSKWDRLAGYHVFRHSFISSCASKGIDQRLIDEWVGHTTEEMRQRYRHLWPNAQHEAIRLAFG
jgi:integrase